jgi:hypothetical protein
MMNGKPPKCLRVRLDGLLKSSREGSKRTRKVELSESAPNCSSRNPLRGKQQCCGLTGENSHEIQAKSLPDILELERIYKY